MSKINIGGTILQLRKEKNITQEKLSAMVGVSPGAVCKWETEKSMPDITLLPSLARALGVSIDTLLSFKAKLSDEDIVEMKKELTEIFLKDGYCEGEKRCVEYLKDYPNSVHLKMMVAGLIQMYAIMSDQEAEGYEDIVKGRMGYALRLFEEVVEDGDSKYVNTALFSIAGIQMMLENYEASEKALKELANAFIDPMSIYPFVLHKQGKNEEAKILCESMLLNYLNQSVAMLSTLSNISIECENDEEALIFLDGMRKIEDEFQVGLYSGAYKTSRFYIKRNELDLGAKWFKAYAEGITSCEYDYKNHRFFKDLKLQVDVNGQKIIRKKMFKSLINEDETKVLEGLKDYEKAIEILKENI